MWCSQMSLVGFSFAAGLTCSTPSETERVIGLIDPFGERPATVDLPSDAVRGQPFELRVYTFGSSSCTTPDDAELEVEGLLARITPYDRVPSDAGVLCTRDMARFAHPVKLRFETEGVATLRVVGWIFRSSGRVLDSVDLFIPVRH
jgi:hypothetical protein